MDTLNPGSFSLIASDAIESFNKESNCYLKTKKARKKKVVAVDKKYAEYGNFLLTLKDSNVEVAFKSKETVFHVSSEEKMLSDLNDALQYCDVYETSMDYFVVRKMAYVDVNDVEGSKDEMKKSLKYLLEDVNTIIKQSLPWPGTTEDDYVKEENTKKVIAELVALNTITSSMSSGSTSSRSQKTSSSSSTKKSSSSKSLSGNSNAKQYIDSMQKQIDQLQDKIADYQQQMKSTKDTNTKRIYSDRIKDARDEIKKRKESIKRTRESMR